MERAPLFLGKTFDVTGPADDRADRTRPAWSTGSSAGWRPSAWSAWGSACGSAGATGGSGGPRRLKIEFGVTFENDPAPAGPG